MNKVREAFVCAAVSAVSSAREHSQADTDQMIQSRRVLLWHCYDFCVFVIRQSNRIASFNCSAALARCSHAPGTQPLCRMPGITAAHPNTNKAASLKLS